MTVETNSVWETVYGTLVAVKRERTMLLQEIEALEATLGRKRIQVSSVEANISEFETYLDTELPGVRQDREGATQRSLIAASSVAHPNMTKPPTTFGPGR